jgi:30S ribosomal protein S31
MGKGDKKTKKGKIVKGSYGVSRPRKSSDDSKTVEKKQKEPVSKATKAKTSKK